MCAPGIDTDATGVSQVPHWTLWSNVIIISSWHSTTLTSWLLTNYVWFYGRLSFEEQLVTYVTVQYVYVVMCFWCKPCSHFLSNPLKCLLSEKKHRMVMLWTGVSTVIKQPSDFSICSLGYRNYYLMCTIWCNHLIWSNSSIFLPYWSQMHRCAQCEGKCLHALSVIDISDMCMWWSTYADKSKELCYVRMSAQFGGPSLASVHLLWPDCIGAWCMYQWDFT